MGLLHRRVSDDERALMALQAGALRAIRVKEYPYDSSRPGQPDRNPHTAEMTTFDLARIFHPGRAEAATTPEEVLDAVLRTTETEPMKRRRDWEVAELERADFAPQAHAFAAQVDQRPSRS
jgi:hypothetical protein